MTLAILVWHVCKCDEKKCLKHEKATVNWSDKPHKLNCLHMLNWKQHAFTNKSRNKAKTNTFIFERTKKKTQLDSYALAGWVNDIDKHSTYIHFEVCIFTLIYQLAVALHMGLVRLHTKSNILFSNDSKFFFVFFSLLSCHLHSVSFVLLLLFWNIFSVFMNVLSI